MEGVAIGVAVLTFFAPFLGATYYGQQKKKRKMKDEPKIIAMSSYQRSLKQVNR